MSDATYCYAHGIVPGWCRQCPPAGFPQVTAEDLDRLDAELELEEGRELERRLEQVLGPLDDAGPLEQLLARRGLLEHEADQLREEARREWRRDTALAGLLALLVVGVAFLGLWIVTSYPEAIRDLVQIGGSS